MRLGLLLVETRGLHNAWNACAHVDTPHDVLAVLSPPQPCLIPFGAVPLWVWQAPELVRGAADPVPDAQWVRLDLPYSFALFVVLSHHLQHLCNHIHTCHLLLPKLFAWLALPACAYRFFANYISTHADTVCACVCACMCACMYVASHCCDITGTKAAVDAVAADADRLCAW